MINHRPRALVLSRDLLCIAAFEAAAVERPRATLPKKRLGTRDGSARCILGTDRPALASQDEIRTQKDRPSAVLL